MEFPTHLNLDLDTRAGRMLAAGNVVVTVKSLKTGEHITVKLASRLKNDSGRGKKWQPAGPDEATHIFASVRSADRAGWDDKIGTYYPRNGRFYEDNNADPARVWAAAAVFQWLNGDAEEKNATYQESNECGRCGRQLTDPVSIDRGIGPDCYGQMTGSQHQEKVKRQEREARGDEAAKAEALREAGDGFEGDQEGLFS